VHAADVDLARRCADGDERAWDRFVREYRPVLYRAADALDPRGGAREIADSLYAELFGVRGGNRSSLFHYFQGRSSLATWLRAVLAQRYVDHLRARRRLEPLPDGDEPEREKPNADAVLGVAVEAADPDRSRHLMLMRDALAVVVARLSARDRLRLGSYYRQELTLAETGRLLGEHEATVSRQLARTRRTIREQVEGHLRDVGLGDLQIAECFSHAAEDPGPIDLSEVFDAARRPLVAQSERSSS